MNDDKEFIQNTDRWPNWPFLPVKRYNEHIPQCGTMIDANDARFTIFNFTIFGGYPEDRPPDKIKEYSSVDELLADGWMID